MARPDRPILVIERLDRLLAALRPNERWTLRHHLQAANAMVIATATDPSFAGSSGEPFFGQLDTWALSPLEPADAGALFARVGGERSPSTDVVVAVLGGQPSALVVAGSVAHGFDPGPSAVLRRTIDRLGPQLSEAFRGVSPLGQQIAAVLARAPRSLTATEVQSHTSATSAAVANAAKALESAGVLRRAPDPADGRVSRYVLVDAPLRLWLETSGSSWDDTRLAASLRVLGRTGMPLASDGARASACGAPERSAPSGARARPAADRGW